MRAPFSAIVAATVIAGIGRLGESEREKGVNFQEKLQNRSRGNFDVVLTANPRAIPERFKEVRGYLLLPAMLYFYYAHQPREDLSTARFQRILYKGKQRETYLSNKIEKLLMLSPERKM